MVSTDPYHPILAAGEAAAAKFESRKRAVILPDPNALLRQAGRRSERSAMAAKHTPKELVELAHKHLWIYFYGSPFCHNWLEFNHDESSGFPRNPKRKTAIRIAVGASLNRVTFRRFDTD
jgi:hypothetical protein